MEIISLLANWLGSLLERYEEEERKDRNEKWPCPRAIDLLELPFQKKNQEVRTKDKKNNSNDNKMMIKDDKPDGVEKQENQS